MSRQFRGDRDHVSRDYQEGYNANYRDLRDLRDFRDFHRDTLDERDGQGITAIRSYRDDYPEEYDHRPTTACPSANLINNPILCQIQTTNEASQSRSQLRPNGCLSRFVDICREKNTRRGDLAFFHCHAYICNEKNHRLF